KKWSDYEQELWEVGTQGSQESAHSRASDRSHRSSRSAKKAGSAAGSVAGDYYDERGRRGRSRSPAPPFASNDPRMSRNYSTEMSQRGSVYGIGRGVEYDVYGAVTTLGSRPVSMVEGGQGSDFPSDEEILQEIRNILSTANLMSITKKQVRDDLSQYFGMDMSLKKDTNWLTFIKELYKYLEEIDISSFLSQWNSLKTCYPAASTYLSRMKKTKEKWAACYNHVFIADMTTTQHEESMNNMMKGYLDANYQYMLTQLLQKIQQFVTQNPISTITFYTSFNEVFISKIEKETQTQSNNSNIIPIVKNPLIIQSIIDLDNYESTYIVQNTVTQPLNEIQNLSSSPTIQSLQFFESNIFSNESNLVSKTAIRLIIEDYKDISLNDAKEIMIDSVDFGLYVHNDNCEN
ncbi:11183_t:CDS:2, partial [Funneliformis caledonium]